MYPDYCVHVVDDDASVRESLKLLLGGAGYTVHCYPRPETFLEEGASIKGCALIDLCMGEVGGLEVQKALIAQNSPVAVIIFSAYGDVENAVKAMRLGAVDFIEKPFEPDELLKRVSSVLWALEHGDLAQQKALQQAALINTLTPREKQVMSMIVDGMSNKQVAASLAISPRTVETHRVHLMHKLNAESVTDLVRSWLAAGSHVQMRTG